MLNVFFYGKVNLAARLMQGPQEMRPRRCARRSATEKISHLLARGVTLKSGTELQKRKKKFCTCHFGFIPSTNHYFRYLAETSGKRNLI